MEEKRPDCPFCAIVAGDGDADVVYRDDSVVAFLDKRPVFPGHLLVIPARHVEVLGDATAEEMAQVGRVVQAAARAMESVLGADGSFVAQNNRVSQSVPHMHVHVVPRHFHDGLKGFFWPRQGYESDEQRVAIAAELTSGMNEDMG
jgi:histidine triad (HIT) family protein